MSDTAGAMFEDADDGLVVQLADVEELKFEILPKGTYDGIISDVEYSLSKNSGAPMWRWTLTVAEPEEYQGRKLFTHVSFSEKALPGTKTTLAHVKPSLCEEAFRPNDEDLIAELIGTKVRFQVKVEKYNDEDTNRVGRFMAVADSDGF